MSRIGSFRRCAVGCTSALLMGLGPSPFLRAQSAPSATLTFARFAAQVEAFHPVAQQARLARAQSQRGVQEALGGFDPKWSVSVAQKAYGGSAYFTYLDAALKVPTPFGADLKLAFDRSAGSKISPDQLTPRTGLWSLGITVPLGQRILTDERRTALTVARLQRDAGEADFQAVRNKLLLDAAKAYGAWYTASQREALAREGFVLADRRLEMVRARVRGGENAPVDTVEAGLELARRRVSLAEAQTEAQVARWQAELFLWDVTGAPVALGDSVRPVLDGISLAAIDTTRAVMWMAAVTERHPDLRKADAKWRAAEAERWLALQGLLPAAEGTVASLAARDAFGGLTAREQWNDNYKAGLDVSSSLLLLKERGKAVRSTQKAEIARWDRDRIRRDLVTGVQTALADVRLLSGILETQRRAVQLAAQLRDAEQQRFLTGESTLLVVLLRERLVLDEAAKLAAIEGKLASARAALVVAVGDPALIL